MYQVVHFDDENLKLLQDYEEAARKFCGLQHSHLFQPQVSAAEPDPEQPAPRTKRLCVCDHTVYIMFVCVCAPVSVKVWWKLKGILQDTSEQCLLVFPSCMHAHTQAAHTHRPSRCFCIKLDVFNLSGGNFHLQPCKTSRRYCTCSLYYWFVCDCVFVRRSTWCSETNVSGIEILFYDVSAELLLPFGSFYSRDRLFWVWVPLGNKQTNMSSLRSSFCSGVQ